MTKEEWIIELKAAQDNLNALVEEARSQNNVVNLTVITSSPLSTRSLVFVELVNDIVVQPQPQIIDQPVIPPVVNEQPVVNEEPVV